MAKRGEIKNISKVLEDVISQKHFKVGIDNLRVQEAWVKTMGENIQKYTYGVKFKKGKLYIKLKSSVLKEELIFEKNKVITLINLDLFNNFSGLANVLINLDLFITVSNSTAHLASALGVKTIFIKPESHASFHYWNYEDGKSSCHLHNSNSEMMHDSLV